MARRDVSWQFIGGDGRGDRQMSEEPALSYDEDADMEESIYADRGAREKHAALLYQGPDDHEDILHPLREAANRVGREVERFAEVLDGYNPHRATDEEERYGMTIDLLNLYYDISSETLKGLRLKHSTDRNDDEEGDQSRESSLELLPTTVQDLDRWEQETQTWDLLRRLVDLRFPRPDQEQPKSRSKKNVPSPYASEKELWESFLESDDLALERKTVLQWLKDTADDSGEDINAVVQKSQRDAEREDVVAQGWLYTKQAIKNQKRIHTWNQSVDPNSADVQKVHLNQEGTLALITQLDPDAPNRQDRTLETKDQYYERAMWIGCYELLRRGKTASEIREWCNERAETWRAVSMLGLPFDTDEDSDDEADPASILLWRRTCYAIASRSGGDDYQKAVYGILSGDVESVEAVCNSWNDFVFVHYNALLKHQYDQYLQGLRSQIPEINNSLKLSAFDVVAQYGDSRSAGKQLVARLRIDSQTSRQTLEPMKLLQGVLIADDFKDFIYHQGLSLSRTANIGEVSSLMPARNEQPKDDDIVEYVALNDHDGLRVLVHTLLIFRSLGMDLGSYGQEVEVENCIVAYISFLRLAGKEELIPLYSSQLSGVRKYAVLARNLIDVTDHNQRITQLKLMRELGLDVQNFVKMQSRFLLSDHPDESTDYPAAKTFKLFEDDLSVKSSKWKLRRDFLGEDNEDAKRIDMLLIRSLEWYLLVDGMWSETYNFGTMLYMRFYKHMHLLSASVLASRITSDQIARNKTRALLGESMSLDALLSEDEDVSEVMDGSAELKNMLRRHMFEEAKSFRELECLAEHLANVETISTHVALIEEEGLPDPSGYKRELAKEFPSIQATGQILLNGWLLSSKKDSIAEEFQQLREAYLPDSIMAYIEMLQFGGIMLTRDFLLEVMNLAPKIAHEKSDVLELFNKTGRMQDLVTSFARVSKTLVVVSSERKQRSGQTKKMKSKGWNYDLWNTTKSS